MKDPKIKSPQQTRWNNQRDTVAQPTGIDYGKLQESINKQKEAPKKDLRKQSYVLDGEKVEDDSLKNLDKNSIIPVPGLLIEHENDESDYKSPTSDWIAPHGPQWGPMTQ